MPGDTNHTGQTFQTTEIRQLLVLVRFKSKNLDSAMAITSPATSKIDSAMDAVDNVMANVPGLNNFLKEEIAPEVKCDQEYTYFNHYADWEKYFNKLKEELKDKLHPDNETLIFDFESDNDNDRKSDGQKLYQQVLQTASSWKQKTVWFHFVGLGQGGNIANECINQLIQENDFKDKWFVKSVIYIGTPLYKDVHVFDEQKAFRDKGQAYAFGNYFDLTHQVIGYLHPAKDLLKIIAEYNSNPANIFIGKLKMQVIETLTRLLSALNFGTGEDNAGNIDKITKCKDDVESLAKECMSVIGKITDSLSNIVSAKDIPPLKEAMNGWETVPGQCKDRLSIIAESLKKLFAPSKGGVGGNLDTQNLNPSIVFNCLCPLVDKLTDTLRLFTEEKKANSSLAAKITDTVNINKIYARKDVDIKMLPIDPYIEKMIEMAKATPDDQNADSKNQPTYDQSVMLIRNTQARLTELAKEASVNVNDDATKQQLAMALTALLLPMVPTKEQFIALIMDVLPMEGLNSFLEKLTAEAAAAPLKKVMEKIRTGFDFLEDSQETGRGLKTALKDFDTEFNKIKRFFKKENYKVHKDVNTLYFIYNSHNLLLKKPYGPVMETIEAVTGYRNKMIEAGYYPSANLDDSRYDGKGSVQNENAQTVYAVQEQQQK